MSATFSSLVPPIDCYINGNRWLSNFHLKRVFWRGLWFNSNEHAFQFTKGLGCELPEKLQRFHSPVILESGQTLPVYTPSEAKKQGRIIHCREDWDHISYAVMLLINIEKFSTNPERQWLLDTGLAQLIEGNWWHDNKWGKCMYASRQDALLHLAGKPYMPCLKCADVEALNLLGGIHMRIRADIQFDEKLQPKH